MWFWIGLGVLVLLIMAKRAKASMSGQNVDQRIQELANAISGIEGGSELNPGNIRDGSGKIGESGDLNNLLQRGFIRQNSNFYYPGMTFRELAWMYVAGAVPGDTAKVAQGDNPDAWASYVANQLGVSVDSTVGDFINS